MRYGRPGTRPKRPGTGRRRPGTGYGRPGTGLKRPGTGRRRPGTGYGRLGIGHGRPGTRPRRPGTPQDGSKSKNVDFSLVLQSFWVRRFRGRSANDPRKIRGRRRPTPLWDSLLPFKSLTSTRTLSCKQLIVKIQSSFPNLFFSLTVVYN